MEIPFFAGITLENFIFADEIIIIAKMITADDIKILAERGESYKVDFKATIPQKVRDITEEVCSFANASGGYVLIGIDDQGVIKGANIDNSKRSAIQGSIGEISPALHCELYSVDVEGKDVWVIDVPAGKHTPYFFGGNVFVREGANSQKLTNVEEISPTLTPIKASLLLYSVLGFSLADAVTYGFRLS